MKQGDILLITYRFDPICWLVRWGTKSKWGHVIWILNKKEGISAHGTGIKLDQIQRFKNKFLYKTKVIRLSKLSSKQIRKVTRIIKKQKCSYNYFKFIGNFFSLLLFRKRVFPMPTCALLIASALQQVGYNIKKTNLKFITPEDFNCFKYSKELPNKL